VNSIPSYGPPNTVDASVYYDDKIYIVEIRVVATLTTCLDYDKATIF